MIFGKTEELESVNPQISKMFPSYIKIIPNLNELKFLLTNPMKGNNFIEKSSLVLAAGIVFASF